MLAHVAREVHTIERIRGLYEMARANLQRLRLPARVRVAFGDGMAGLPGSAPFDAILVAAAYVSVGLIVVLTPHFWPMLAVAVTIPRAFTLARAVRDAGTERAYSMALRGTNRLLTEFGLLMAAGLLAGAALSGTLLVP